VAKLTYTTEILFSSKDDHDKIVEMLEAHRLAFNAASKVRFGMSVNSIILLHKLFYQDFRKSQPFIPAQIAISAQRECLSAYQSVKSNRHKITSPVEKTRLSMRLDKRSHSYKKGIFSIISLDKRVKCQPHLYPKLQELMAKYELLAPLLFMRAKKVWIALIFNVPENKVSQTSACGIDLGIRMAAVTSEGKFYQDKTFNCQKRKLRYLKRKLQVRSTKSARKHLRKLQRKERYKNHNQTHRLANAILHDAKAKVLVMEDLTGIKAKTSAYQNKNAISQVPFYQLKQVLTYKAPLHGKQLISVSPYYTSQIDHRTGKKDGTRKGRRYIGKDGIVLDADQNASINIAQRSKLPVSYVTILDGQAAVNRPIACKPCLSGESCKNCDSLFRKEH
jgi:IS605 OrfB family transposase